MDREYWRYGLKAAAIVPYFPDSAIFCDIEYICNGSKGTINSFNLSNP